MATSKRTSLIILFMVIAAALYTAWTATGSSMCVTEGMENQTRTTFAPFEGCTVVDDYRSPDWMFERR